MYTYNVQICHNLWLSKHVVSNKGFVNFWGSILGYFILDFNNVWFFTFRISFPRKSTNIEICVNFKNAISRLLDKLETKFKLFWKALSSHNEIPKWNICITNFKICYIILLFPQNCILGPLCFVLLSLYCLSHLCFIESQCVKKVLLIHF